MGTLLFIIVSPKLGKKLYIYNSTERVMPMTYQNHMEHNMQDAESTEKNHRPNLTLDIALFVDVALWNKYMNDFDQDEVKAEVQLREFITTIFTNVSIVQSSEYKKNRRSYIMVMNII